MALARHMTPNLTMNTYARTRDERLAELAEKVGQVTLAEEQCATCVQKVAAGAEGMSLKSCDTNALRQTTRSQNGGFNPPRLHQNTEGRQRTHQVPCRSFHAGSRPAARESRNGGWRGADKSGQRPADNRPTSGGFLKPPASCW